MAYVDKTRAALLATGLLAALLGPVGAAAAATGNADVEDYRFPSEVRIEPGDKVRWTNRGNQGHTVTTDDPAAEDFDSGQLGTGDTYTHTFNEAGTFAYHCEIYSSMSGVVQVGPPPTTTTSSTTTTTTLSTTTTTQPAPPATTTTRPPPTTTTVPRSPTTTVTTGRTPAGAESPAPIATTAPTTTTTRPAATTTTAPAGSTTTTAGETTTTTTTTAPAASAPATPLGPEVPEPPPPQEEDGEWDLAGQRASAPHSGGSNGGTNAGVVLLVAALLGAGAFGGWTLWKLRPGTT